MYKIIFIILIPVENVEHYFQVNGSIDTFSQFLWPYESTCIPDIMILLESLETL